MTENLAGRGEGLAGLVAKWRNLAESAKYYKEEARRLRMELAAEKHAMTEYDLTKCAKELETALEAAARLPFVGQAPPSTAPPTIVIDALRDHWPTWIEGEAPVEWLGVCSCGKAKASGVTPYKQIWSEHMGELVRAALATPSPQAPQCCCNVSWLDLDQRDCPIHGALTPQASSEIRERLENADVLATFQKYMPQLCGNIGLQTVSQITGALNDLLAPSRQGAAKRVEG